MIFLKSEDQIEQMQLGANILSKLHGLISGKIVPGVTTRALNSLAEEFIYDNKAKSSFKGYRGFPAVLCTSVNNYVVHGIPDDTVLEQGDIVSVDCGVLYNGFHTDSAYTHSVGSVSSVVFSLLEATKNALDRGVAQCAVGNKLGDVGYEIGSYVVTCGYSIVKDFGGHGIGANLHEDPEISNFGKKGKGLSLQNGMVLAIEPIVNMGKHDVIVEKNGIVRTKDGSLSAHFEHTVAIVKDKPKVLTSFEYISKT